VKVCEHKHIADITKIQNSRNFSENVHFILSGEIHLMDRNNYHTYGYLGRGSYFGEIGVLMNCLNQFDYIFYGS